MIVDIMDEFSLEGRVRNIFERFVDERLDMRSVVVEVTLGINEESFGAAEEDMNSSDTIQIRICMGFLGVFR